jgi:hypothetical protein
MLATLMVAMGTTLVATTMPRIDLPIDVQGVLGRSPIEAGITLTTLVFGWPLAVTLLGQIYRSSAFTPRLVSEAHS